LDQTAKASNVIFIDMSKILRGTRRRRLSLSSQKLMMSLGLNYMIMAAVQIIMAVKKSSTIGYV
jgi:hypothetical protein